MGCTLQKQLTDKSSTPLDTHSDHEMFDRAFGVNVWSHWIVVFVVVW
jgi:hypothetical protein